jgi:hypothetical protein
MSKALLLVAGAGVAIAAGLWFARRSSSSAPAGDWAWLKSSGSPDRAMSSDYWNAYRVPGNTDRAAAAEVEAARKNAFGDGAGGWYAG